MAEPNLVNLGEGHPKSWPVLLELRTVKGEHANFSARVAVVKNCVLLIIGLWLSLNLPSS